MGAGKWERFCIVGVGGHARTKLIPALVANRQRIAGLVSGQRPDALPCGPIFATLEEALAGLPADTAFVIATPPSLHFEQACTAIAAGRDVIVEKPGFVTERDAREIARRCEAAGSVLVEGFMHRHTLLFERLMNFWELNRSRVRALSIAFLVPSLPAGTFRQAGTIESSSLYDIGCYGLSLLADLKLPLADLQLAQADEAIDLAGRIDGIDVTLRIGVAEAYENSVELHLEDGTVTRFSPFFYGRPAEKRIETRTEGKAEQEALADVNGFRAMFDVPRSAWRAGQAARLARMIEVTRRLEQLGADLAARRPRAE
jgi:predicted dehydrogenase